MKCLVMILFTRLDIGLFTEDEEIRKSYLNLAKIYHPDKGGTTEEFSSLNEAYKLLRHEEIRNLYRELGLEAAQEMYKRFYKEK